MLPLYVSLSSPLAVSLHLMTSCLKWNMLPSQEAMLNSVSQRYRHKEEQLGFNKQLQTSYISQQSQHLPFQKKPTQFTEKGELANKQSSSVSK